MREENEIAYSSFKYTNTNEIYIFEGRFLPENCNAELSSICKKNEDRNTKNTMVVRTCLDEDEARQKAASLGKVVCGVCVSHLYTTYDK